MSTLESFDPDTIRLTSGCLINGQRVAGDGGTYEVRRPSDEYLVAEERSASAAMVDAAVDVARRAFRQSRWRSMPPRERAAVMLRWADLIVQHTQELARLESVVSTRTISVTQTRDVLRAADIIRYYAELIDKVEGQVLASSDAALSMTLREPHGVVAAISHWNVPLVLATIKLAPALAAGNAIVLKPGENTCYAILRAAELAVEAGIPAGQIGVLPGLGAETGDALVKHPDVDYVTFTGSTETGARGRGQRGVARRQTGLARTGRQESESGSARRGQTRDAGAIGRCRHHPECRADLLCRHAPDRRGANC